MKRIVLFVLSVAALTYYFAGNDARHEVANAVQTSCAAYAANGVDCPYQQQ